MRTVPCIQILLESCANRMNADGSTSPLSGSDRATILHSCQGSGLRLLAVATRTLTNDLAPGAPNVADKEETAELATSAVEKTGGNEGGKGGVSTASVTVCGVAEEVEEGLTLLAVFGIADLIRPEVPAAVKACRDAGVRVRMLTGDNKVTAASIAGECGILDLGSVLDFS
jgi:magnesium-transporting ATPase (P-type)